ncbi:MAG: Asp-tRNA(Asn)/Glu-tRNA(Gln) amidotransferase subunit GatB [Tahibacter sp.]
MNESMQAERSAREWQAVIGLEIHAQLTTASKLFSAAPTAYGAEPNTQTCSFDIALPGVLPTLNREAVRKAIRFGLAIGARIERSSIFARKNYFYPDLPKGYQISQFELPIVAEGSMTVRLDDGREFVVEIQRAHLEEDAGKSLHDAFGTQSGIDLNRAGVPLLEIVSAPVMHSAQEAVAYMRAVHTLVRWLGVCDGNMQEGSFRCDANVSVRPLGEARLGTRAEIKNVNSFRFVEKAIEYEIERQIRALENGEALRQETRLYDAARHQTRPMRSKEMADDYRYFPDPDLPPLHIEDAEIEAARNALPELPQARRARYMTVLGLPADDATQLSSDRAVSDYFEDLVVVHERDARACANWILGDLAAALNEAGLSIEASRVDAANLSGLLRFIADGTLSGKLAKEVFAAMWAGEGTAEAVIAARGLQQISDPNAIAAVVDLVLAEFPQQALACREGDEKLLQFLVGQSMKRMRGRANPQELNATLRRRLALR